MSFWITSATRKARARDGVAEVRHVATLHHHRGGHHTLQGPTAAATLAEVALRWTKAGFDMPAPTKAAGDKFSTKARQRFFLSAPPSPEF
jgi:hypothetical protein